MRHVRIDPRLIERAAHSRHTLRILGVVAGFANPQSFSRMMCSGTVPGTTTNVVRLRRLAEALDFPPDLVFLDEFTPEPARRRKDSEFDEVPPPPPGVRR